MFKYNFADVFGLKHKQNICKNYLKMVSLIKLACENEASANPKVLGLRLCC